MLAPSEYGISCTHMKNERKNKNKIKSPEKKQMQHDRICANVRSLETDTQDQEEQKQTPAPTNWRQPQCAVQPR